MNKIDKRLADLYAIAEYCKSKHAEGSCARLDFHTILCQLEGLVKDLREYHLIEKCRCCCDED